jgi:hypothetical protein
VKTFLLAVWQGRDCPAWRSDPNMTPRACRRGTGPVE